MVADELYALYTLICIFSNSKITRDSSYFTCNWSYWIDLIRIEFPPYVTHKLTHLHAARQKIRTSSADIITYYYRSRLDKYYIYMYIIGVELAYYCIKSIMVVIAGTMTFDYVDFLILYYHV